MKRMARGRKEISYIDLLRIFAMLDVGTRKSGERAKYEHRPLTFVG